MSEELKAEHFSCDHMLSGSSADGTKVCISCGDVFDAGYNFIRNVPRTPTVATDEGVVAAREDFAPCPLCKQYSHSIGEDRLAAAFMHFQSMYAHPVRGHPMGDIFDEQTRDAAQVLMSAAIAAIPMEGVK